MQQKVRTGINGLDEILEGGLLPNRSYLIQGGPGAGKSTVGYHFLEEGNKNKENTLLISLSEKTENILENVLRLNIDLSATHFLDLSPNSDLRKTGETYSVFSPSEVEQKPLMQKVMTAVEQHAPSRVVLDSITMLNMLHTDSYQARQLALSFIHYICENDATLLMLSEQYERGDDSAFWVNGIISLGVDANWRNIEVTKYRGSGYKSGKHAFKIIDSGIEVYPRLQPSKYERKFTPKKLSSGINELDGMLSGGLERGTTTLLTGPSGVGKTNLGIQFIKQAASQGERSAIYTFEESKELILKRSEGINVPIENIVEKGNLKIAPIEPLSYSPDEFSKMVRTDVEDNDTRIVMIDAVGGYRLGVGEENALPRLHSLCVYLQNMGVTTILVNETSNLFGEFHSTELNASYLADNIIFLRYLEYQGELQKSIGILKKRMSNFEPNLREFEITEKGIKLGARFQNMQGILTGQPEVTSGKW